ncbi:hypothetical protein FGO68_gene10879 [Halteria grandinella]|uniref:Uncharacterized protein n=1 Tax=Halteria grandinella TaxID=5974 RepID=A0A8J8TA52_HALGN|nr:hypothetical protein FGO68_gene10879 [Halteria grandinella]
MELKRQKQALIEKARLEALKDPCDIGKSHQKHVPTCVPLFRSDKGMIKALRNGVAQANIGYKKVNKSDSDEAEANEEDDEQLLKKCMLKRRNVGDKWLSEFAKSQAIDSSIQYDLLKELIDEDNKTPKLQKYYSNCLGIQKATDDSYLLIYPSHMKTHVNVDSITIANDKVTNHKTVASDLQVMFNGIQQLEFYNQKHLLSRDYYSLQLSTVSQGEDDVISLVKELSWSCDTDCLIKFRQSPYLAEQVVIMSEKSKFFTCRLDERAEKRLPISFKLGAQDQLDFKQDLTYFDFGFHPQSLLAGNFRDVYAIDLRAKKASHLLSSQVHSQDNTFNKFSAIHRISDQFNHFALIDEEKFLIYDIRSPKIPVHSIDHYLHETVNFTEIVQSSYHQFDIKPSLEALNDLTQLLTETKNVTAPSAYRDFLVLSSKHPSHLLNVRTSKLRRREDAMAYDISRLTGWDYNLIMKGVKPQLVQSSPIQNHLAKVRGCQLIKNGDESKIVVSCDSLGGLYLSVMREVDQHIIERVGQKVQQKEDIIRVNQETYAKEDNQIAQINFKQKYTFNEVDCSGLLDELLEMAQGHE